MAELAEFDDRRTIEDGNLRLVFQWTGDRWEHWLEDPNREFEFGPRIIANVRKADPERDDPLRVVSPTYQQLQFQPEGSGWLALLVGQSGPHHFSAVFTFKEGLAGGASINVDVADRCRVPIESFASTYTVNVRPGEIVEASPTRASWEIGPGRLSFVARAPARVVVAESGRLATSIQALAEVEPGSSTHRLLYDWHWC